MEGGAVISMLFFLVIRLIAVIYCSSEAKAKNRSVGGWATFGFFLPLIAMIAISIVKKEVKWQEETNSTSLQD